MERADAKGWPLLTTRNEVIGFISRLTYLLTCYLLTLLPPASPPSPLLSPSRSSPASLRPQITPSGADFGNYPRAIHSNRTAAEPRLEKQTAHAPATRSRGEEHRMTRTRHLRRVDLLSASKRRKFSAIRRVLGCSTPNVRSCPSRARRRNCSASASLP